MLFSNLYLSPTVNAREIIMKYQESRLDRSFMGPPLSGRDLGQAGKARPLHACLRKVNSGTAKKKLERVGTPRNWNCCKILPRTASRRLGE